MSEKPTDFSGQKLSFGLGNASQPMEKVARYAFRRAMQEGPHEYVGGGTAAASWGHRWGEAMGGIADYFTDRGFSSSGYNGLNIDGMLTTNGTTNAYDLALQIIADDVAKRSKYRAHYNLAPVRPVIVMPIPTYGLFLRQPEKHGIEIVTIQRDMKNGGRVNFEDLRTLLRGLIRANKRVVAYYDSNPNNPLGTVRGYEETKEIGRLLMALAYKYDSELDSRGRGARMSRWCGAAGKFRIIDDMVYDGLEYAGAEKPYPFALLEKELPGISQHTMTLFSTSKAGLATLRAGLVIGEPQYIREMGRIQNLSNDFSPAMTVHALAAYFSKNKIHAGWRNDHLRAMNAQHEFAGKFMKALVNGVADVSCSPEEIERMKSVLRSCGQTEDRLNGIKGVRVITSPQAGFFHLLDFSGLRGGHYARAHTIRGGDMAFTKLFREQESISHLAEEEKLGFLYGNTFGVDDKIPIVRATFAKPLPEIAEFAVRLDRMAQRVTPPRVPRVQKSAVPAIA